MFWLFLKGLKRREFEGVGMDLDSLDAPMFVDFDLIKRGEEEGEGDEWFGEFNNKIV